MLAAISALEYNLLKYSSTAQIAGVAFVKFLVDKLVVLGHKLLDLSNKSLMSLASCNANSWL